MLPAIARGVDAIKLQSGATFRIANVAILLMKIGLLMQSPSSGLTARMRSLWPLLVIKGSWADRTVSFDCDFASMVDVGHRNIDGSSGSQPSP